MPNIQTCSNGMGFRWGSRPCDTPCPTEDIITRPLSDCFESGGKGGHQLALRASLSQDWLVNNDQNKYDKCKETDVVDVDVVTSTGERQNVRARLDDNCDDHYRLVSMADGRTVATQFTSGNHTYCGTEITKVGDHYQGSYFRCWNFGDRSGELVPMSFPPVKDVRSVHEATSPAFQMPNRGDFSLGRAGGHQGCRLRSARSPSGGGDQSSALMPRVPAGAPRRRVRR